MNQAARRKNPFRTTSRYLAKMLLLAAVVAPGTAHADWESTLKSKFPIVETFDNIADWSPARGAGNYYTQTGMPKKTDGSKSIWTYYSSWATGGTSTPWIGNFGAGNSVTGKSAIIDIGGNAGPSRLGTYFGNGTPNSGYSDIYIFYRAKYPKNEWPTAIDSATKVGSYTEGRDHVYWASWKANTLNMGCTGVDANTQCSGAEPYSNYHLVPHVKSNGTPRRPYYRIEPTGYVDDPSKIKWTTGYEVPRDKWAGVEFHYRNYQEGSQLKTAMDVWIYDEDGTAHQVLANAINDYTGLQPATDRWNFFFIGGNNSASYTWGSTMLSKYYIDDVIISGTRVGPTYYTLWNANKGGVAAPAPPQNLRLQ